MTNKRSASAIWNGGIKDGKGAISTQSGALKSHPYGFSSRFEGGPGTNPEELLGAAHAGCFTMALSLMLTEEKLEVQELQTKAEVTLEKLDTGFTITAVHLDLKARVAGVEEPRFQEIARKAKENCPLSKVINARITMSAELLA